MHTLEAVYTNEPDAKVARERLISHGIALQRISIIDRSRPQTTPPKGTEPNGSGLWANIKGLVALPDERKPSFEQALKNGGYFLTANVPEDRLQGSMAILEAKGAVRLHKPGRPSRDDAASHPSPDFQERLFEFQETAEEVTFEKQARVKEELVVRKLLRIQTQPVSARLARTEATITDLPHEGSTSALSQRGA